MLEVVTEVEATGRARMLFKQIVRNKEQKDLIYVQADVSAAGINTRTLKPKALPKQLVKEIICER